MKILLNGIKDNINLILIATLIFSIKPLEFLAINLSVANFADDLVYPMVFHLLIFSIYITIFILSLQFKRVLVSKFFIFLAVAYYLQYFALDIRDFMLVSLPILLSQTLLLLISIFLIILISFLFTYFYFRSKNKHVFIFGASLLCLSQIAILLSNLNYLSTTK